MLIVLLVLAIWVLISFIIAFPLGEMMHIGSREEPKSRLSDADPALENDDPTLEGHRHNRHRTRLEPRHADLPVHKRDKDVVFQ